jgi:hypothetical protein
MSPDKGSRLQPDSPICFTCELNVFTESNVDVHLGNLMALIYDQESAEIGKYPFIKSYLAYS